MFSTKTALTVCAAGAIAFAAGLLAAPTVLPRQGQPEMDEAMTAWMTPDEHHKALEPLLGEWEGAVKIWMTPDAEPMELTGTASREWAMDGRFLIEHITGTMPEGEGAFHGMGIIGYNTVEHTYESFWIENMATYMSFATGSVDPEKHTIVFEGDVIDPMTGARTKSRFEMNISAPPRHVAVGYTTGPDG